MSFFHRLSTANRFGCLTFACSGIRNRSATQHLSRDTSALCNAIRAKSTVENQSKLCAVEHHEDPLQKLPDYNDPAAAENSDRYMFKLDMCRSRTTPSNREPDAPPHLPYERRFESLARPSASLDTIARCFTISGGSKS